jgi:hypothetical protein
MMTTGHFFVFVFFLYIFWMLNRFFLVIFVESGRGSSVGCAQALRLRPARGFFSCFYGYFFGLFR